MARTAIQLYTLREMDATMPEILEKVGEAGYDGVEFAYRVLDADVDACVDVMEEYGLDAAAAHVGLDELAEGIPNADAYERLGVERLVVAYLDASHFASEMAIAETAETLDSAAEEAAEQGFEVGYHNHEHEFVEVGGQPAFEALIEETERITFELDVGWAHAGGTDPAGVLERHGARIPLIHVTDVTGEGESAEVGEGEVDLQAAANTAKAAGTEWFVYEYDDPDDLEASLAHGARALADLA